MNITEFELGLGFVVAMVIFIILPDSNSFSITLYLWLCLACQRVFLSVLSLLVDFNLYFVSVSQKVLASNLCGILLLLVTWFWRVQSVFSTSTVSGLGRHLGFRSEASQKCCPSSL